MHWQRYLVYFGLVLKIFGEDDFIDTGTIFRLFLQALLDDHIEIFGDALGYRLVLRSENFLLQLFDVLGVIGVLLRAHFIQHDTQRPDIRSFRLVLVLPKFGSQVIWSSHFFNFVILARLLPNPLETLLRPIPFLSLTLSRAANLFDVAEIAQFGGVVLRKEDVQRLDITVDHVPRMQIVHSKAYMDEDLPKEVVGEGFAVLFLDRVAQVAMLAVLHHYANGVRRRDEAVEVAHHKV